MKKYDIKKIEVAGHLDFRRVAPWDYNDTIADFRREGIELPSYTELKRISDQRNLWASTNGLYGTDKLSVTVTLKNGHWMQWVFEPGFIFDKASVPVFRNNVLEAMIAALVHDANVSLHFLTFAETNGLFHAMLRYYGMNAFRAGYYYLAVNSIAGRGRWENNDRGFWHDKTVHFMTDLPSSLSLSPS